jgi:hypothetical protein
MSVQLVNKLLKQAGECLGNVVRQDKMATDIWKIKANNYTLYV